MINNKVSILVPIYGVEKYIERCARSLFGQTYSNIEYIFVNDCTRDKSIEILMDVLDDFPHRKEQVKLIHHERNRGLAAARNTAIANMTGDYLWHIDSDDYIETQAVELLVNEIQKTNAEVIIFGYNTVISYQITPFSVYKTEKHTYIKQLLLNAIPASMWNKFYSASFYRKIGVLSIEGINQGEDYAVIPRILYKTTKIGWLDKPLYFYDMTNLGSYSNNISLSSIKSLKKADDVLYDFFREVDEYKDVIDDLYIRSMLFLIKTSQKERYKEILNIYGYSKGYKTQNLSLSDNLILYFLRNKWYSVCELVIKIAKKHII